MQYFFRWHPHIVLVQNGLPALVEESHLPAESKAASRAALPPASLALLATVALQGKGALIKPFSFVQMLVIGVNMASLLSEANLVSRAHIKVPFGDADKSLDDGSAGDDDVHGDSSVGIRLGQLFD